MSPLGEAGSAARGLEARGLQVEDRTVPGMPVHCSPPAPSSGRQGPAELSSACGKGRERERSEPSLLAKSVLLGPAPGSWLAHLAPFLHPPGLLWGPSCWSWGQRQSTELHPACLDLDGQRGRTAEKERWPPASLNSSWEPKPRLPSTRGPPLPSARSSKSRGG